MSSHTMMALFGKALDEARDFVRGPSQNMVELLSGVRFGSADMFEDFPADAVERMVKPSNARGGSWESSHIADIARALDYGYRRDPSWFDGALSGDRFAVRGLEGLCEEAVRTNRSSPMDLLFGLNPGVAVSCRVSILTDLAGLARIALLDTKPQLVRYGNLEMRNVPPFGRLDTFPALRLTQVFGEHSELFPLLDCSDEEKYLILYGLRRAQLLNGPDTTAVMVGAAHEGIPLHRALRAYGLTRSVEAALVGWDMPEDYLTEAFSVEAAS